MFNQDRDSLSIVLTEQSIKIAQARSSGAVVKVVRRALSGSTGDAVARELKAALAGFNPKKTHVLCVIPASVATTKNIEIPSVDPEEIKSIINLQAARHTPFSREEILVGHVNLGSYQSNFTKALLVIVNRNVVKERLKVLESAGLEVHKVVFEPEGIARFYAKALNVKKDALPIGIIDVGPHSTAVIIESRGTAAMCRSVPIGTRELSSQGAEARDKLVAEIKTSLDSYREEEIDKIPAYFLLTSAQGIVKDLQPSLASALGTPVQVTSFIDHLRVGGGFKKTLERDFAEDSLTDVLAPAITAGRCEVNLIPEEILMKRGVEQQSKEAMVTGVLVIIVLFLVGLILGSKNYFKETFLKQNLRAKYAGQHEEVLKLEAELRKTKIIRGLLDSRLTSLEILRGLYAVIPKDIYLNSINATEDGVVTINGIAETTSRVYAFVGSLSESKSFDGVKTKSTAGKKDRGKDMIAFEIEFVLSKNAVDDDIKKDAAPKSTGSSKAQGVKGS
jgi:Tfp pilus assembly PilM family ATPase/Tfp pilus assembly protein PilN